MLENIIEWAINLASQQPRRLVRRLCRVSERSPTPAPIQVQLPVTPAPVQVQVCSPRRHNNRQVSSTSGSPRNQVLPINWASSGEPMFLSIHNPAPVYPQREEHWVSSGEEIVYTPPPPQTIQAQENPCILSRTNLHHQCYPYTFASRTKGIQAPLYNLANKSNLTQSLV